MSARGMSCLVSLMLANFGVLPAVHASGMTDDPLLSFVRFEKLEVRSADGSDPWVWDGQGWVGHDLNKFWFKTEGEYANSDLEDAELQLLYSRAFAPFWDVQLGWRGDFEPTPRRSWAALGVQGLVPYFFDIEASAFLASGRAAARLDAEYEILLTQRLILAPEAEANWYSDDDPERGIGSGLSELELGLRLRYEFRREFAPYIGLNWFRKYGDTADLARAAGEDTKDLQFTIGLRVWF